MKRTKRSAFVVITLLIALIAIAQNRKNRSKEEIEPQRIDSIMKLNKLTKEEEAVIIGKGTEAPFSGSLLNEKRTGTFHCKQCEAPLYRSEDKFDSQCGWPSFDDEIEGAVLRSTDADGRRTEITCKQCGAHLGHVFEGERFTAKDTRHCVNSISMIFIPSTEKQVKKAYFASGCFWGTEYYMAKKKGVIASSVGFMGGHLENPSYKQVCTGATGHLETIELEYDPSQVSYDELLRLFFETHDFTQRNGQGPDIGPQYLSAAFYSNDEEKASIEKHIAILNEKGYKVATMIRPTSKFWIAEDYHQDYYDTKGGRPYCHAYKPVF